MPQRNFFNLDPHFSTNFSLTNKPKTKQTMKTTLLFKLAFFSLFLTLSTSIFAQSTATPDTVCAGASGKIYKVSGQTGSTFNWVIKNGTKASGGTSDSITINWSATPGIDTLKVVEVNFLGCPGDTVSLAVLRLAPPTVVVSGTDSICLNSATVLAKLQMNFTGQAPWLVNYTEAGVARTVSTSSNPYNFNSQLFTTAGIKAYIPTSISDRLGCSGTYSGSASVTVMPKPATSAIMHY
ncbi:MAG: hypothetical protein CFE21_12905 [Bacteroidetes bacterium B1(2017)]|nr:MAG: hypothetical protein CFE21_12905 [Bacteroidetes bacterium B1(2017)]